MQLRGATWSMLMETNVSPLLLVLLLIRTLIVATLPVAVVVSVAASLVCV